jgi:hypothetical protein
MVVRANGFRVFRVWTLGLSVSLAGLSATRSETGLKIEIDIYNYSVLSRETLSVAEVESDKIFRPTGIAAIWLQCPLDSEQAVSNKACARPGAPTRLTLRLLPDSMANRAGVGADVFGSAILSETGGYAVVANVYTDRARTLLDNQDFGVILGRIMAHEVGHLLLGKPGHSIGGLMRAEWRSEDLEPSRAGSMLFLPGEAKRMRAQVLARMARAGSRIVAPLFEPFGNVSIMSPPNTRPM